MEPSSNPLFARMAVKLEKARRELENLQQSLDTENLVSVGIKDLWGRTTKIAAAVYNVYNGIEDVMFDVAKHIDGMAPTGESSHQELLDQMALPLEGKRPALLDPDDYKLMVDLKGFRHVVRHKYGIEIDLGRAEGKHAVAKVALDKFDKAMTALVRDLDAEDDEEPTPQPR